MSKAIEKEDLKPMVKIKVVVKGKNYDKMSKAIDKAYKKK